MWDLFLWKKVAKKSFHRRSCKSVEIPTLGCGEKIVAAVRGTPVFHISFLYPYQYYLSYLLIYIYVYFIKKGTAPCVLPVKRICCSRA